MSEPLASRRGASRPADRFPKERDPRAGARLVIVGLGSNRDAEEQIRRAVDRISYRYHLLVKSTRYVGPPEGATPEVQGASPMYSNAAVLIRTADSYGEILATFRALEAELGRDRSTPEWVDIDIDILLIDGEVVRDEEGQVLVPHADLASKRHAALPSAEVGPNLRDPRSKESIATIAGRLT